MIEINQSCFFYCFSIIVPSKLKFQQHLCNKSEKIVSGLVFAVLLNISKLN